MVLLALFLDLVVLLIVLAIIIVLGEFVELYFWYSTMVLMKFIVLIGLVILSIIFIVYTLI